MDNIVKIRPKFWSDGIWFIAGEAIIILFGYPLFNYILSKNADAAMFSGTLIGLLVIPIFGLMFLDQILSRVVFTADEVIFRGLFYKHKIAYKEIVDISSSPNAWAVILYQQHKKNRQSRSQSQRIFFWAASSHKIVDELKKHTRREIAYPDKIARANMYGRVWIAVITLITIAIVEESLWQSPTACFDRYRLSITNSQDINSSTTVKREITLDSSLDSVISQPIYFLVTSLFDAPKCSGSLNIQLLDSAQKVVFNQNKQLVPQKGMQFLSDNLNENNKLTAGKYRLNIFYGDKLKKVLDLEIK